jgi:hypothetical protein
VIDSVFNRPRTGLPPSVDDLMLIRASRATSSDLKVTNLKTKRQITMLAYSTLVMGNVLPCAVHFASTANNFTAIRSFDHISDCTFSYITIHISQNDGVLFNFNIRTDRSFSNNHALQEKLTIITAEL